MASASRRRGRPADVSHGRRLEPRHDRIARLTGGVHEVVAQVLAADEAALAPLVPDRERRFAPRGFHEARGRRIAREVPMFFLPPR